MDLQLNGLPSHGDVSLGYTQLILLASTDLNEAARVLGLGASTVYRWRVKHHLIECPRQPLALPGQLTMEMLLAAMPRLRAMGFDRFDPFRNWNPPPPQGPPFWQPPQPPPPPSPPL